MGATDIPSTFSLAGEFTINRMGFGAMRLTGKGVWGPPADREEALRVLRKTVALGINFIDTADSYGPEVSEELIAEALHPYPENLVIATKGGFIRTGPGEWQVNTHLPHLRDALYGSLERLKLDRIDLYQLHRIGNDTPFDELFKFLRGLQEEGLVKHIGLSEVSVDQVRYAREIVDIVSVQNKYSVDFRKWEDVLEYCEAEELAFIPWNPMNAGNVSHLDQLAEMGKRYNATPHQVALSWLYRRSPNILLIPGTSKVSHLEENFQAAAIDLSEKDMKALDQVKQVEV